MGEQILELPPRRKLVKTITRKTAHRQPVQLDRKEKQKQGTKRVTGNGVTNENQNG